MTANLKTVAPFRRSTVPPDGCHSPRPPQGGEGAGEGGLNTGEEERRNRGTAARLCLLAAALLVLGSTTAEAAVPSFQEVCVAYRPSDLQLLDRHGEVLHELRVDDTRRRLQWTPLAEVSPALQAAVIAAEDRRFYQHGGVDGRAVAGAALQWVTGGARRGASTVTMQVATMLDPALRRRGGPRTLRQKWRQMQMARAIEAQWTKAEILEAYLNLVTFRGELQGVGTAAHVLFGKAPHGLAEGEAAVLAALLRAPGAGREAVARRAQKLLEVQGRQMSQDGLMAAVAQALEAPRGTGPRVTDAVHAAHRLFRARRDSPTEVGPVRSTLDAALQRMAAETLQRHLLAVQGQRVQDGAVLVVDNATGEVLAYVGGSGDLSSARYVDGIQARRQAGSSLKPFLYGLALEQRLLTPASLLEDTPLEIPVTGGLYRPQNYDEQFRGLVSARTALASSLNIPAVRTLELVGAEAFVQQLQRLGFAGLRESGDYYGPALALGSADVSLWELVNAYRTLANGGVRSPLRLMPIADCGLRNAECRATKSETRRVYSPEAAFLVSHILADRESRSATFGLENPLATRFWTAVKTGTSKDMRDNWCVGYSRRYTVGVWVGNFSGEPMRDVSGITGAAPVWVEVMRWLHRGMPSAPPEPPSGLIARRVAFSHDAEPERIEWFLRGTEPRTSARVEADALPRIITPVSGTRIALDPDIPPDRQRVLFEAKSAGPHVRWVLNGQDLGVATKPLVWQPAPGKHTVSLVDEARRVHHTATFEVRGPVRPGAWDDGPEPLED